MDETGVSNFLKQMRSNYNKDHTALIDMVAQISAENVRLERENDFLSKEKLSSSEFFEFYPKTVCAKCREVENENMAAMERITNLVGGYETVKHCDNKDGIFNKIKEWIKPRRKNK